ncbi:divergent polysaccharide deacetylase family protein [Xenorhabdus bovienii]|uniref:divergent polysaccharide deacetylase family protein n=1 Tax=Xenorhabdus bovienii TaxID=40576 RepID=UPI003BA9FAF3|nr:divergent polysaccharide deacetylase family protein [Xenorhabdus bovienii]
MVKSRLIRRVIPFTLLSWMLLFCLSLLFTLNAHAARLAIVIDDFGYRVHHENKILQMPTAVSIAILPDSPHGREMAQKAHKQGREILIHLPMAPLSKQPLEKNTLHPSMSREEIGRIIHDAIQKVPHATGMNNHMGSAMTSSLDGMEKVMQVLSSYRHLYFLDSVTIGKTQVTKAAMGTPVQVLRRHVFLDNVQTEAETRHQLNRAIALARKQGSAIAIGHPYPTTVRALQQALTTLPDDIELVTPSRLLNPTSASQNDHQIARKCAKPHEPETVPATKLDYLKRIGNALTHNAIVETLSQHIDKLLGKTSKQQEVPHNAEKTESTQKDKTAQGNTDARTTTDACADF